MTGTVNNLKFFLPQSSDFSESDPSPPEKKARTNTSQDSFSLSSDVASLLFSPLIPSMPPPSSNSSREFKPVPPPTPVRKKRPPSTRSIATIDPAAVEADRLLAKLDRLKADIVNGKFKEAKCKVEFIGKGDFHKVYRVTTEDGEFAIKRLSGLGRRNAGAKREWATAKQITRMIRGMWDRYEFVKRDQEELLKRGIDIIAVHNNPSEDMFWKEDLIKNSLEEKMIEQLFQKENSRLLDQITHWFAYSLFRKCNLDLKPDNFALTGNKTLLLIDFDDESIMPSEETEVTAISRSKRFGVKDPKDFEVFWASIEEKWKKWVEDAGGDTIAVTERCRMLLSIGISTLFTQEEPLDLCRACEFTEINF